MRWRCKKTRCKKRDPSGKCARSISLEVKKVVAGPYCKTFFYSVKVNRDPALRDNFFAGMVRDPLSTIH